MRQVVRDAFLTFTEPLEGGVPCFYDDMRSTPEHPHGIVTIAYGNAIFTPSEAAALPLMQPGGVPATAAEKVAAWQKVHDDPQAAHRGWQYAATLTTPRLTREGMGDLALARLESNERILRSRLPDCWDDLPACAQLALHSLAWACGANTHYPRLFTDVAGGFYEHAAVEIHMNEWTPEGTLNKGLIPRNVANKILMKNAAHVVAFGLDPDTLDWVHDLEVSAAPTLPSLPVEPASSPTIHVDPSDYLQNNEDPEAAKG